MAQPIPPGSEGLIPHLFVQGAAKAIEFYKEAFGAEELFRSPSPNSDKLMHAELTINGRVIYVNDDFPEMGSGKPRDAESLGASPVTIHQYVEDCDAAVARAEKAGVTVTMPPDDMFWGDRYATVRDPFGHEWSFATHLRDVSPQEMEEASRKMFS